MKSRDFASAAKGVSRRNPRPTKTGMMTYARGGKIPCESSTMDKPSSSSNFVKKGMPK